ncbi:MAG: DUF444 family protein [Desulfobacteraceae bacterium]|jgi:uncharacterized sporulation protein YeaH/YhbH (DUF444 family)
MNKIKTELIKRFETLKQSGLSAEREQKIVAEINGPLTHATVDVPEKFFNSRANDQVADPNMSLYDYHDFLVLQKTTPAKGNYTNRIRSIDELLEKDKQRAEDGFPRKIRVGRMIKPGRGGKDKVVVVPNTVEEKFMHDPSFSTEEEESSAGGSGDGQEGEVIGEQPVRPEQQSGAGPGQGEDGEHEMESNAYDLGRILTEQFELPNLKDKGKRRSLTRYTYDLTDKNRGFGQVLDKKSTLRKIIQTNINLGRVPEDNNIDPTEFLISPKDKVYRILSREKDFESQAVVFFLRDYSGSMAGKTTDLIVAQHVMIYSWLLYQYAHQVESRFILHDTSAKEVSNFYTYYNSKVAGGTQVSSAYRLVNEIVHNESLATDYNIYIFHGTDGDDWDTEGKEAIPELKKMLAYANRIGVSIAQHSSGSQGKTEVDRYLSRSGLLKEHPNLIRLDVFNEDADESRLIDGIKALIS